MKEVLPDRSECIFQPGVELLSVQAPRSPDVSIGQPLLSRKPHDVCHELLVERGQAGDYVRQYVGPIELHVEIYAGAFPLLFLPTLLSATLLSQSRRLPEPDEPGIVGLG